MFRESLLLFIFLNRAITPQFFPIFFKYSLSTPLDHDRCSLWPIFLPATAMNRRKSLWKYYRLSSFPTPFSPDHRVPFINFQFGKVLLARGIVRPTSPRNIVQPTKFVSIDFHCGEGHKKTDKTGRNFFLPRNYNFYLFVRFLWTRTRNTFSQSVDTFSTSYMYGICPFSLLHRVYRFIQRFRIEYCLLRDDFFSLGLIIDRDAVKRINLRFLFEDRILFEDEEYNFIA